MFTSLPIWIFQSQNPSISKSIMTDTHISENEQMRRAIPNESNTLASLQMSYCDQDITVHGQSMLNFSLHSPVTEDNINMQNSINVRMTFIYLFKMFHVLK